ncbi:sugar phosphate isomerase/epimerase family protein [Paenibacillus ginsengarvi]|nr:sugar phosphate isomerase/epimerase family protein [Paenibacillus ginsengarvi]
MKTSVFLCSYESYYEKGLTMLESVDLAVKQGFDAIEPYPTKELATLEDAKRLAEHAGKLGIPVSCFSMGCDMLSPDTATAVQRLKHYIDIASELRAPYFHHTLVPHLKPLRFGQADFESLLPQIVPAVREVCDYASERGIMCVYEDQGFVFNGVERFGRFLTELDRKDVGVVADLGNILFVDETPEQFVGRFSNRLVHVHVKDYLLKSGEGAYPGPAWYMTRHGNFLRDTVFGHGSISFVPIFRMLRAIGYDGYFSAEYVAPEPAEKWLPISMDNLKRYYEQAQ